jgi:photosystem II stability/assembly factor-like uncharacterized protein
MRRRPSSAPRLSSLTLAAALVVASSDSTGAQTPAPVQPSSPASGPLRVDSMQFRGMSWRSIGPNRGGRSITVAGSASRPLEYYFGAVGGGVWKTTDGGTTWAPVSDGAFRASSVGALAVSESNPDVVYAGMGETCLRGNIMQGDGVYKSTDAGKTWTHVGLAETQAISKIRVDPRNPDVVWVAAFGHPYGRNPERGVYKSTDGGKSWRRVLYRDDRSGAIDLSLDPKNPDVLYAALWEASRTSWQMTSGGPGSGLFTSRDGGEHWSEITRNPGLPAGVVGRIGVAVSPVDGNRVWAIVENANGGVFRSDDAGATWKKTNDERKLRQRAFYYTHIAADPQNRDRVYVMNVSFFRSDDGGARFDSTLSVPHGDNHDLWIAPNDNRRMIEANDGGGTVSVNGGRTWTEETFPTAQLYHVATTADFPYHVCGAQQDNTTACLPSKEWDNLRGARSRQLGDWMYDVGGGESGYIAPDPLHPNIFYAGSQGALLTRYDRSNGQMRDVQVSPRFFSGEPASALPERWQWTYPIVFSPKDRTTLYTSSQHLWRTTDEGQHWTRISPDLTRADPATLGESGGPITHDMNGPEIYGTIFTVAPSPLDARVIWTGSDDGLVHVTRDGGASWSQVTPPGLPTFARVSLIDASHADAGTAYLAAKNYQLDDRAPYLYRTHDFGRTWTRIVAGIRADDYVHAVREDPTRRGLLYAGTEHGIYVSWNDGASWRSLSLNLPDTQVPDIAVEANDLVIATHGRSMYVLDDIAPIRAWAGDGAAPTGGAAGVPRMLLPTRVATRGDPRCGGTGGPDLQRRRHRAPGLRSRRLVPHAHRLRHPRRHHRLTAGLRDTASPAGRGAAEWTSGPQSLRLGPPLSWREHLRLHDHLECLAGAGAARGAGQLPGARLGERRPRDHPARRADGSAAPRRHCRRSARAVRAVDADPRPCLGSQRCRAPYPSHAQCDRRPRRPCAGPRAAGRYHLPRAERGGGRAVSGTQPQRPGSAQLPDSDQQPHGRAWTQRRHG